MAHGEINIRIVTAKEALKRKISLMTSKPNIDLSYVWSIARYQSETWALRKLERKCLESFQIWCSRRRKKIKRSENAPNEEVLQRIEEKRTLLNKVLHR